MRKPGVYFRVSILTALSAIVMSVGSGCVVKRAFRTTYYVHEGKYLLKDNDVIVQGDGVTPEELSTVLRQQPNASVGIRRKHFRLVAKFRLMAFNAIRPEKAEKAHQRRLARYHKVNVRRLAKEIRINNARREEAVNRGDSTYFYRSFKYKDTVNPRLTIRERIKYKIGEAPVEVDTFLFNRSQAQLQVFLRKHGYYKHTITAVLDTVNKRHPKIVARYDIVTGPRLYIDSFFVLRGNPSVVSSFENNFLQKVDDEAGYNHAIYQFLKDHKPLHIPFNEDELGEYRSQIAKFMRDESYYGFSPTHIEYFADTNINTMSVKLGIIFKDRMVKSPNNKDSLIPMEHRSTQVKGVYFHICDTVLFTGNFTDSIRKNNLTVLDGNRMINTLDAYYYSLLYRKVENHNDGTKKKTYFKSAVNKGFLGIPKDSLQLNPFRVATFYYNGKMFIDPGLLEAQNYLEHTNYYKEYYFDRTYNRLLQLGLFSVIKPEIVEIPGTGKVDVHYYLVPSKRQSIGFEPRATNSNGFLGVAATMNYSNLNLFRSGWLTTLSLSGGFESQPPVFDETQDGKKIKKAGRSFNTFEIGPSIKFDIPGFFPVKVAKLPKRSRPRTILSAAYSYQHRPDFERSVFQMNYLWKLYVGKTQIVSAGLPLLSVIKFVTLNKSPEFEARIVLLNDLFLRNAYSDQLIWEDFKLVYDFDNKDKDFEKKISDRLRVTFNATLSLAGNALSMGAGHQKTDSLGHRQAFGVAYSQFGVLDTKYIAYYAFSHKNTLAFRAMAGAGIPYGNTNTSLPYDYSFFAGGSNDNRGFIARTLGPGSYKYYLDTNRTLTQIGDIRLGSSLEWRLGKGFLQSAFFIDAGNIWTFKADVNRPGGQFSKNWYKEIAVAAGYGLRLDFDFFVIRFDLGIPLTNPALPQGARWIFQSRSPYLAEISTLTAKQREKLAAPFAPHLNIGIGFPF